MVAAGGTLENLFDEHFPGSFWKDGYIYRFGEQAIISEDFYNIVDNISCSDDIVFTVFHKEKRVFTTIVNPAGSSPIGSPAQDNVIADVLGEGKTMLYDEIDIYGVTYIGYYIPIDSPEGDVGGMFFAGKPVKMARENVRTVLLEFITISAVALAFSVILCVFITEKMSRALSDIRQYMNKVAKGDFSASLTDKTLALDDEIGDMGRDAVTLCTNLRDMVERDPLTMLLNRRSSRMKIDELRENKTLYTVVMGDIDFFKNINDTYGHACGDYVLKEISDVLKRYASENDAFVARWGGEEFLLVFISKSADETLAVISDILDEIRAAEYVYNNEDIKVTMTFGISQVQSDDNAESAVNRADELLYNGKQSGRNKIVM